MAKKAVLNISANNENLRTDNPTLLPKIEVEKPKKSIRTSLVIDPDEYEYVKRLSRTLSVERDTDVSISHVLNEIIRFHREGK